MFLVGLGCAPEPEEPNAFMTQGTYTTQGQTTQSETTGDSMTTNTPEDVPGDGDADPTTTDPTTGDGDGDPGDGDADPTTTGGAVCGNGVIDDGEQCDGGNLGGFTCVDLGYSGGTLACDPVTCTYDASACVIDGGTSGGTSG